MLRSWLRGCSHLEVQPWQAVKGGPFGTVSSSTWVTFFINVATSYSSSLLLLGFQWYRQTCYITTVNDWQHVIFSSHLCYEQFFRWWRRTIQSPSKRTFIFFLFVICISSCGTQLTHESPGSRNSTFYVPCLLASLLLPSLLPPSDFSLGLFHSPCRDFFTEACSP